MSSLILYSYWRSSCAYRVRIALNLKGLAYEYRDVHLVRDGGRQNQESYRALNPMSQVPCLIHQDRVLTQSLAIVAYLDRLQQTPPLFPGDPFRLAGKPMSPPLGDYLFGTDTLGRDVAAAIAHGAKTSLMIGFVASLVAVMFGTVLGAVAGYFGGRIDDFLMRLTEVFQTIPSFIFAILLVAILSPSIQ